MTRLEDQVRKALIAEADRRTVDLDALWDATRARLRPHRRGRVVALVAAAVVAIVVGVGAVVWLGDGGTQDRPIERPTQAPTPPQVSPSPAVIEQPRARVLRLDLANVLSVYFAGTDHAIAVWDVCERWTYGCMATMLTRTDDGWASSDVMPPFNNSRFGSGLSASTDGSIAMIGPRPRIRLLEPDGQVHEIAAVTHQPTPASLDEAIFQSSWNTGLWAYDWELGWAHPMPRPRYIDNLQAVAPPTEGRLWVLGSGDDGYYVAWTDDGGATWVEHALAPLSEPSGLAVGPNGEVLVLVGDARSGAFSDSKSIITYDNGATWQRFEPSGGPTWLTYGSGVVALSDGTAFAVDGHDHVLWTSSGDWQEWTRVPQAGRVSSIQTNGELLWAGHGPKQIVVSDDGGQTWQAVIPG
jgi:hypothetical protein